MSEQRKPPADRIDEQGNFFAVISEMYEDYKNWCITNGEKPETAIKFGKGLAEDIPNYHGRVKWKKINGKMERVVMNFGHRTDAKY